MSRLVTAVVGAGPAGLTFCIAGRILGAKAGVDWPIHLFDKRVDYVRTHRLRIAAEPWRDLQRTLDDWRFDAVIGFLASTRFTPVVNDLEQHLSELATELGVVREQCTIGPDDTSLGGLRDRLLADGRLQPDDVFTVVGADSVHSAIRSLVSDVPQVERTHQHLARLRITGRDLPESLGMLEQYRVSKLLGSVIDYRLNRNGFAEVDLFLARSEHRAVVALDANPKTPVPLPKETLRGLKAPFFRKIVQHFQRRVGTGSSDVALYSTFKLEHRFVTKAAFERPDLGGWVFLVGDAAVSLPFFRGMASLARCVASLAEVHVALARHPAGEHRRLAGAYDTTVAEVAAAEIDVVTARGRLIRFAREFIRISALLPFPIQSWFLSAEQRAESGRLTPGLVLNLALALPPAIIATAAPLLDAHVWEPLGWLWLTAVPFQVLGGAAYDAARVFEPGPQGWVKAIWRFQILFLLLAGTPITVLNSWVLGKPAQLHAMVSWWVLGIVFAAGLFLFDRMHQRWWAAADWHLER